MTRSNVTLTKSWMQGMHNSMFCVCVRVIKCNVMYVHIISFWFFTGLLLTSKGYDYITATHTGHLSCLILYTQEELRLKVNIRLFLQHVLVTVCLNVGIDCCHYGNWAVLLNVFGTCPVGIWASTPIILIEIYCWLPHTLQTRTAGLLKS
jgi:hypothetical protein